MNKYKNTAMKKSLINYLIVALMLTMMSCSSNHEGSSDDITAEASADSMYKITTKQFQSSDMKLGKIEMQEFHKVIRAKGMIDVPPEYRISVSSYFGGTVKNIQLLPGEQVKKGQHLFILENPDFVQMQQDFLEAKGKLTYLESDYERQKNLYQDKVSSQKDYLKAESEYIVTKVKVESLGKKLELMNINPATLSIDDIKSAITITSPINGYITQVNITRGTFLKPTQTAITIVNTDHLHLELNIFEKDLSKVHIGQSIRFKIQEDSAQTYKATVYLVNKSVDPENRTIGIHGHLENEKLSEKFSPGMYVEADIYTTSESKKSLLQEALVDIEGEFYVLALERKADGNYLFEKKKVNTGATTNGYMEILNTQEFEAEKEFLVSGAFNLIKE